MEEKTRTVTVFRGENPEELSVYHAASLKDEIRFYINDTLYVSVAEKGEDDIDIELKEKNESEEEKRKLTTKERLKILLICLPIGMIIGIIAIVSLLIGIYFNSMFIYLVILNSMMFILDICKVMVLEAKTTSSSLKSKHSAEHMMVNFLEKHKRLPKSIKEVRTASRFSKKCGSRHLIKGIAEEFLAKIVASIFAIAASVTYLTFFNNLIIDTIIFIVVYFGIEYLLIFLFKKSNKLNLLTKPIRIVLTNLAQCANTTKKVRDKDIFLAYVAAREWIQIVYPEYYNKEQDVFFDSILNNDNPQKV